MGRVPRDAGGRAVLGAGHAAQPPGVDGRAARIAAPQAAAHPGVLEDPARSGGLRRVLRRAPPEAVLATADDYASSATGMVAAALNASNTAAEARSRYLPLRMSRPMGRDTGPSAKGLATS